MIVALASAGAVAVVAWRIRLLSSSGAVAATLVGASAVLGGPGWVSLLLFFFVGSTALAMWRSPERQLVVGGLVEKGGRRDAIQVLANGGVFAAAAVASTFGNSSIWQAVGAGAIAAATADTWSTEVGTVLGGTPRLIVSGRPVPPGTSGGVTAAGMVTSAVAAILAALVASGMHWEPSVLAIATGGVIGSLVDSVLGATIQERRWCETCSLNTERRRHSCGTPTIHRGGIRGFDNDIVNLTSTLAGAAVTWTLT